MFINIGCVYSRIGVMLINIDCLYSRIDAVFRVQDSLRSSLAGQALSLLRASRLDFIYSNVDLVR